MSTDQKEMVYGNNTLAGVLAQGEEQARQLRAQLHEKPAQFNYDLFNSLANNIHQSFETAISMVKLSDLQHSGSDSPQSDYNSNLVPKDYQFDMCKKRKSMEKWSKKVRVVGCLLGGGMEQGGTFVDDGFSWRKYGQKDILGAKYPRSYYRCTHRMSQGCLATKHVQRSDSDPSFFDVSYRGVHTCFVSDTPRKPTEPQQTVNLTQNAKSEQVHNDCIFASFSGQNGDFSTQDLPSTFVTENVPQSTAELGFGEDMETAGSTMFDLGFDQSFHFDASSYF